MNDAKLISITRCPIDRSQLEFASPEMILQLNRAIERGDLRDQSDQRITRALESGLLAGNGSRIYPIRGEIPSLVPDEAINIATFDFTSRPDGNPL